jgi:copper transport protein
MAIFSRVLLALGVLLALLVGVVTDATAHAALVRSDPPAGAVLPEAPSTIRLWFTEPLEASFTRAQLLNAAGEPVAGTSSAIAPEDDHALVVTLPADLPDGGYTVAWRNLSAADGHTLEGYFGFRVGAGEAPGSLPEPVSSPSNDTVRAFTRALALIGLTALLAIPPVTLTVLDPTARAVPVLAQRLPPLLRRYALVAAGVALLGSVAALAAQSATVAPDVALTTAIGETVFSTRYGQIWLVRLLALLLVTAAVLVAFWGRPSWRRAALVAGTAIGLLAPVPFSLLSHAAAETSGRAAAITADALHLLAAAIWGGGLLLLTLVVVPALPSLPAATWRDALRVTIPRFSAIGLAAWGLLLLSRLYSAWLQVGSVEALLQTPYGQSLLLKGVLLVPVLALAARHLVLGWRGPDGERPTGVARGLALEALLLVAVLLVVGRLIGQEPAREVMATSHPTGLHFPVLFATGEGDRTGRLVIAPGAAGVNSFTLDIDGAPLPEDAEGVLRFTLPARNLGHQELRLPQTAPNRFAAQGSDLALAGEWRVTAIVRAIGAFSWTAEATLAIGETPPAPAINPAPVFSPVGAIGMIGVAIGLIAVAATVVSRGVPSPRREGVALAGLAALVAGGLILSSARLPVTTLAPDLAQAAFVSASPPTVSPSPPAGHHHAAPSPDPVAAALPPGIGTPVSGNGLVVTLIAETLRPGLTDITITVADRAGSPVANARVVVFSEMPGMGMGSEGTPAVESEPGRYRAEAVPLSMSGPWQLTVRISPRNQPTSVFPFAVEVP